MTDQINLRVVDGAPFYAHEVTVNFTPAQFSMDFKCITPRSDPRSKKPSFQMVHNLVMLDPWHAKAFLEILDKVVKRYEEDFGKIKKPKAIEKAEKKQKKKVADTKAETPSYLG